MELGCFLAGMMFSMSETRARGKALHGHGPDAGPPGILQQMIHLVEPVKDLFLAIFFASVGMHVYPTFLATNAGLLFVLTSVTLLIKYIVGLMVRAVMDCMAAGPQMLTTRLARCWAAAWHSLT